ncbi:conserved hypothetical protein, secreted [Beggiatoa sp. PS]|nr:conserved hypothetical protein, secreted [Beggiatoa sp. PS]
MKFFIAILLIFINTSSLFAASFNCQIASKEIERMICNTPELNLADKQMGQAYRNLQKVLPKSERYILLNDQRGWLRERDIELQSCIELDCELHFYNIRIQQLGPVEQASFDCSKATTPIKKMICRSRLLRHVDGRMVKLYQSLQDDLRDNQLKWLKERDLELSQPYCDIECIWRLYKYRIEFLVRYTF